MEKTKNDVLGRQTTVLLLYTWLMWHFVLARHMFANQDYLPETFLRKSYTLSYKLLEIDQRPEFFNNEK